MHYLPFSSFSSFPSLITFLTPLGFAVYFLSLLEMFSNTQVHTKLQVRTHTQSHHQEHTLIHIHTCTHKGTPYIIKSIQIHIHTYSLTLDHIYTHKHIKKQRELSKNATIMICWHIFQRNGNFSKACLSQVQK